MPQRPGRRHRVAAGQERARPLPQLQADSGGQAALRRGKAKLGCCRMLVCAHALASPRPRPPSLCHPPQVLQDSLCGSSKVLLVCCVSPEVGDSPETLSSLNFASRAAQVRRGDSGGWGVCVWILWVVRELGRAVLQGMAATMLCRGRGGRPPHPPHLPAVCSSPRSICRRASNPSPRPPSYDRNHPPPPGGAGPDQPGRGGHSSERAACLCRCRQPVTADAWRAQGGRHAGQRRPAAAQRPARCQCALSRGT